MGKEGNTHHEILWVEQVVGTFPDLQSDSWVVNFGYVIL